MSSFGNNDQSFTSLSLGQEPKDKEIDGRFTPSLCLLNKRSVSADSGEVWPFL